MMGTNFLSIARKIYISLTAYLLMNLVTFLGLYLNDSGFFHSINTLHAKNVALVIIKIIFMDITIFSILYISIVLIISRSPSNNITLITTTFFTDIVILLDALFYFVLFSFINFLIVLNFFSTNFIKIIIFNSILNIVPIVLIYNLLIKYYYSNKQKMFFLILTFILSLLLVWPYGSIVYNIFVKRNVFIEYYHDNTK